MCCGRVSNKHNLVILYTFNNIFSNAFKCAVFYENLTPKRNLTWIGALPDALKKAKNQDEVEEILGENVTEESFQQLDDCSTVTANARCYAIVSKTALIS